jgi:hypothetical protein
MFGIARWFLKGRQSEKPLILFSDMFSHTEIFTAYIVSFILLFLFISNVNLRKLNVK